MFPDQEIWREQLIIGVGRFSDDLVLESLTVSAVNQEGKGSSYAVAIPAMIGMNEIQPVSVPAGMQELVLTARYSNGCKSLEYSQSFRDQVASLNIKSLDIRWTGEGFLRLFSCFTPSRKEAIAIR